MGNEYCCRSSKKPLGSSLIFVPSNKTPQDNSSHYSEKENKFHTNLSIEKHNKEYKKAGIKIIENVSSSKSSNSDSFFQEGVINSKIRFPDN